MSVVRVLTIASFAAALAACSPATTRFQEDGGIPADAQVESSPLPPLPGTDSSAPAKASEAPAAKTPSSPSDTWRPYAASKARTGKWSGNTSWKYPPQKRASASSVVSSAAPVPVAADNNWAEKWVPEEDRPAFDAAVKTSMGGAEGHWKTAKGSFGTAFPAVKSGKCATIEMMLSPVNGGLPVTSRGSIIQCQ